MARPRTFIREEVLTKIQDVFWATGFEGTSLADIVEVTGLQKGSLYAAFGDKLSMYLEALAAYDKAYVQGAIDMMTARPGQDALLTLLHLPADAARAGDLRGCFLCNATQETQRLAPEAAKLAEACRQDMKAAIYDALRRGWPNGDWKPSDAEEWLALYFGLRILARSGTSSEALSKIANSAFLRVQASSTLPG